MNNSDKKSVNWYLAAFVDVLGQREILRDLRKLPGETDQGEKDRFFQILKDTAGTVEKLRELFHKFFEASNRSITDPERLQPEQKELYNQLKGNPLKSHVFSDFVSLSLSLRDDEYKVPMIGVYSALASTASTFLAMLAGHKVIRGGIDVGIGLELKGGDVYGSALSRAYEIESKISQYPRIVLGDEIIRYIQVQRMRPENSPFDMMNKQLAELSSKLITIDEDGNYFLDYLGEGFRQDIAKKLDLAVVEKAYKFVFQQWTKFRKEKKSILAFRFMLLRDYFENRLPLWFDDSDKLKEIAQQEHSADR